MSLEKRHHTNAATVPLHRISHLQVCLGWRPAAMCCSTLGRRAPRLLLAGKFSFAPSRRQDGVGLGLSAKKNLGASQAESRVSGRQLSRDAHRIGQPRETSSSELSVGRRDQENKVTRCLRTWAAGPGVVSSGSAAGRKDQASLLEHQSARGLER